MKSTTTNLSWRALLVYSVALLITGFAISLVLIKTINPPANLLVGNFGFGLGFTFFCAIIHLVVAKIVEVITFYLPQDTGQGGDSHDNTPSN